MQRVVGFIINTSLLPYCKCTEEFSSENRFVNRLRFDRIMAMSLRSRFLAHRARLVVKLWFSFSASTVLAALIFCLSVCLRQVWCPVGPVASLEVEWGLVGDSEREKRKGNENAEVDISS